MAREVSKVDVYLDDKGNFVEGDNPNVAQQIAHKGVEIPRKVAARHGLNADGSRVNPAVAGHAADRVKEQGSHAADRVKEVLPHAGRDSHAADRTAVAGLKVTKVTKVTA